MEQINKTTKTDIYKIDPRAIVVDEGFNSRCDFGDIEELAAQIAEQGVLNPITVTPFKDENGNERYRLVDGERRYRAILYNIEHGIECLRVPALFAAKNLSEEDKLMQQIIRNQGKPFSEYEYGIAFKKFADMGLTHAEIAKKLGFPRWKVDCFLAHLNRDERVQKLMKEGVITGVDVRHIYQAAKDEQKAVAQILKLAKVTEKKGEAKISLSDLDKEDEYSVVKDTAAIKKGLGILFDYIDRYTQNGKIELDLDIFDIHEQMTKGKNVLEIFENAVKQYNKAS